MNVSFSVLKHASKYKALRLFDIYCILKIKFLAKVLDSCCQVHGQLILLDVQLELYNT